MITSKFYTTSNQLSNFLISLGIKVKPKNPNQLNSYSVACNAKEIFDLMQESTNSYHREFSVFTGITGSGKTVGLNERIVKTLKNTQSKIAYFAMDDRGGRFLDKNISLISPSTNYEKSLLTTNGAAFVSNIFDNKERAWAVIETIIGGQVNQELAGLMNYIYSEEYIKSKNDTFYVGQNSGNSRLMEELTRLNYKLNLIDTDKPLTAVEIKNLAIKRLSEVHFVQDFVRDDYKQVVKLAECLSKPTFTDLVSLINERFDRFKDKTTQLACDKVRNFVNKYPFVSQHTDFYQFDNRVLGLSLDCSQDMTLVDADALVKIALYTIEDFVKEEKNRPLVVLDDLYLFDKRIIDWALKTFVRPSYDNRLWNKGVFDVAMSVDSLKLLMGDDEEELKYINQITQLYVGRISESAFEKHILRKFAEMNLLDDNEVESLFNQGPLYALESGQFFQLIRIKHEPQMIVAKRTIQYLVK